MAELFQLHPSSLITTRAYQTCTPVTGTMGYNPYWQLCILLHLSSFNHMQTKIFDWLWKAIITCPRKSEKTTSISLPFFIRNVQINNENIIATNMYNEVAPTP